MFSFLLVVLKFVLVHEGLVWRERAKAGLIWASVFYVLPQVLLVFSTRIMRYFLFFSLSRGSRAG